VITGSMTSVLDLTTERRSAPERRKQRKQHKQNKPR
jgi:hypothetical protein